MPTFYCSYTSKYIYYIYIYICIYNFYLGFLSRAFANHRAEWEGGEHFFNSSLPLPPASRAPRHWPGDCCGELTSVHSQQSDSNREALVSERKSLTTKLRALFTNDFLRNLIPLFSNGFVQRIELTIFRSQYTFCSRSFQIPKSIRFKSGLFGGH